LEIHPLCYEIVSLYSELLLEAHQFDTVIDILNLNVLMRMEHDPLLWNYLGLAYLNKKDSENAIRSFEMAVSVDPEYADVYVNLGNLYFSHFLRTKEKAAYSKAIHNYKKAIEVRSDHAEAFNGLGAAYMQVGRVEDAIYLWEVALILEPNLVKIYYYLGLAYLIQEKNTEAYNILSTYKEKTYNALSIEEQRTLDYLIRKARSEIR
jgi:Flp pilus assembly protein TadD